MNTRYAVDLITFYNPNFWEVETPGQIASAAQADPSVYWEKIFNALKAAGVSGFELTFAPADWRSAVSAAGSVKAFAAELASRDLTVVSGFFSHRAWSGDVDIGIAVSEAELYAEFVAACGGSALVFGMPMRRETAGDPLFVDVRYAAGVADRLHTIGAAVSRLGIQSALHNEAHSVFSTESDIDLFLGVTDPYFVNFCPDSAHLVLSGADPVEVARRHRDRVVISHWKDATGAMSREIPSGVDIHALHKPYFGPIGSGVIDWRGWADAMTAAQADGVTLIEIDAVPNPVDAIIRAREFVQSTLS